MYSKKIQEFLKDNGVKTGNRVELIKSGRTYRGVVMPRTMLGNADCLVLKLDNGYNVGLAIGRGDTIKKTGVVAKPGAPAKPVKRDPKKPTISILHTGGTIASRVDYATGGVVTGFSPEEIVAMFPELNGIANIRSRLVSNMWSDDMRFSHYNMLAREIQKEIRAGCNGIIVTHGTDTMHYTAAALAFMLENLPVPVILVGAQRSSDRGSSDARLNLVCAARFIACSDFADVAICMHEDASDGACLILPACKTRKMHTSSRAAFRPVNARPWARVHYRDGRVEVIERGYRKRGGRGKLNATAIKENLRVGMLKIHTNMYPEEFGLYEKFDGLVIEGTGLGHTPLQVPDESAAIHEKIRGALQGVVRSGCVVAMAPQAIYGRINMNVYNKGHELQQLGVLGNHSDMTPETAFIKLAWLLSNCPKEKVRELFGKNLRGEIGERIEADEFPDEMMA